jgi:KDO2-lipid IV(A) lauroyltransferase
LHFLIRLLGRMPLRVLHWLGAGLGWIAYAADRTYRGRLSENLARSGLATGHTAAPGGLGRVRRRAIAEAGRTIAELPAFWLRPQAALARWVRVTVGQQHLDEAHARGRGILFLTPHLGAFEITPQ